MTDRTDPGAQPDGEQPRLYAGFAAAMRDAIARNARRAISVSEHALAEPIDLSDAVEAWRREQKE